jgi:hypothetical protein
MPRLVVKGIRAFLIALAVLLSGYGRCNPQEVFGSLASEFSSWNSFGTWTNSISQYLSLSASSGGMAGYAYLRLISFLPDGEGPRLYPVCLWASYRDPRGMLRISLGRRFRYGGIGTIQFDGIELSLRKIGPMSISLYGGLYPYLEGGRIFGLECSISPLSWIEAGIGYSRRRSSGVDKTGFVAFEEVVASFGMDLPSGIRLSGISQYDMIFHRLRRANIYGRGSFKDLDLYLAYDLNGPYPASRSIYNVFGARENQELRIGADLRSSEGLSLGISSSIIGFSGIGDGLAYEVEGNGGRYLQDRSLSVSLKARFGYGGSGIQISAMGNKILSPKAAIGVNLSALGFSFGRGMRGAFLGGVEISAKPWRGVRLSAGASLSVNSVYRNGGTVRISITTPFEVR